MACERKEYTKKNAIEKCAETKDTMTNRFILNENDMQNARWCQQSVKATMCVCVPMQSVKVPLLSVEISNWILNFWIWRMQSFRFFFKKMQMWQWCQTRRCLNVHCLNSFHFVISWWRRDKFEKKSNANICGRH